VAYDHVAPVKTTFWTRSTGPGDGSLRHQDSNNPGFAPQVKTVPSDGVGCIRKGGVVIDPALFAANGF